jgi:glycyl-tRNA synthetase beta chain
MSDLILEIGTEEIPSDYLDNGLKELERISRKCLEDNRINFSGSIITYGTPRRLILSITGLSPRQGNLEREVIGPPKNIAYDESGNPTKVAIGFAKKNNVSVGQLVSVKTKKGEYVAINSVIEGKAVAEVLSAILPEIIRSIPWPKSMRWGDVGFLFVRPIHWIMAMLDEEVIPFELAGIMSGNITYGHRFMSSGSLKVKNANDYFTLIRKANVIIKFEERKTMIAKSVESSCSSVGGFLLNDVELLSTVTNMVEYPYTSLGSYDRRYLELPEDVLITAMRKHQKYFSVVDEKRNLMPYFVAVNNTKPKNDSLVSHGHERVLNARLSDAKFFFQEDRKRPLSDRFQELKSVVFHQKLGTLYDKVERFTRIAEYLTETISSENIEDVKQACKLCKCDLVTLMVSEFPSLQGTMGEIYAKLDGNPKEVCLAISDHYLPVQAESNLPESLMGLLVGLADRMDTIIACFAVGLEPTGTADPYALRRKALAIIRLIRVKNIKISIRHFIEISSGILNETIHFDAKEINEKVFNFIRDRFKYMLSNEGIPLDYIDAVISEDFNFLHQADKKIDALRQFHNSSKYFEPLVLSFKRIMNILKGFSNASVVNPALFENNSEKDLWDAFISSKGNADQEIAMENYFEALNTIASLAEPIDNFFNEVMVMAEDENVKINRLSMLREISYLFIKLADFSKFTV